ncbi:MAG TPA: hypothetical protein VIW45_05410 [Vicinamibacterales bacterium]
MTVTVAVPLLPSLVAVMTLVPGPTAVMAPDELTVATDWVPEDQVTVRPRIGWPSASLRTAVAVADSPVKSVVLVRDTVTVATAGPVTLSVLQLVTAAVAISPSVIIRREIIGISRLFIVLRLQERETYSTGVS